MKFAAEHTIAGMNIDCKQFDTNSASFESDLFRYCHITGNVAKDYLAIELAEQVKEQNKDYYRIPVSVEIKLRIQLGDMYDLDDFYGLCNCKIICSLKPVSPGLYKMQFEEINREIGNQIMAKYQKLLGF